MWTTLSWSVLHNKKEHEQFHEHLSCTWHCIQVLVCSCCCIQWRRHPDYSDKLGMGMNTCTYYRPVTMSLYDNRIPVKQHNSVGCSTHLMTACNLQECVPKKKPRDRSSLWHQTNTTEYDTAPISVPISKVWGYFPRKTSNARPSKIDSRADLETALLAITFKN